jgi:murein DD-endopeptidase MepM/ murein hydrolase activator NlpD
VINSPSDRQPSHGTHGQGQTYAADFVAEPAPGDRPRFGKGPWYRPPTDFPAFGQPLHAPADARVVSVADGGRDHRSRSSWPALIQMIAASFGRELLGTRYVLGNNVVLELRPGVYAALGHLQRGSVAVRPGDRVRRGDVVGRCGSSGNSSEPHLHFQLMDHPRAVLAAGLPFTFDGEPLPGNEQPIEVR